MQVLFIVFNRPDLTRKVWKRIRAARPERLYIAADGPRQNVPEDLTRCKEVREIVSIPDWDCEVYRIFRRENLGCSQSVLQAINWFFEHESEGVILEDDCLPDTTFFRYCNELLSEYRSSEEVLMIAGSNFIPCYTLRASYTFSRLALIWGWATWRRAWELYEASMKAWDEYSWADDLDYFGTYGGFLSRLFDDEYRSETLGSWSIPWRFSCIFHRTFCVVPQNNLVRNIGIAHPDATHHQRYHRVAEVPVQPMRFPLAPPVSMSPNRAFDQGTLEFLFGGDNPWQQDD